jgi:hypothetical protein
VNAAAPALPLLLVLVCDNCLTRLAVSCCLSACCSSRLGLGSISLGDRKLYGAGRTTASSCCCCCCCMPAPVVIPELDSAATGAGQWAAAGVLPVSAPTTTLPVITLLHPKLSAAAGPRCLLDARLLLLLLTGLIDAQRAGRSPAVGAVGAALAFEL